MLKKALLSSTLLLLFLLAGCSDNGGEKAEAIVASPNYELTNLKNQPMTVIKEGEEFTLKGHENKVVIYDIFATWCPPCRAAAPHLTSLQKKYKDDLFILGITIEKDLPNAKLEAFKAEYGADYAMVNSAENQRFYSAMASAIHIGQRFPIPLMVMYKNGKYVTHYVGAIPEEMIESDIKTALGRK